MIAEHRLVDQVLGHHRRLVLGARDLLDHHSALAVELPGVDSRPADEVGQQVGRLEHALGPGGDVEGDQIVTGVGVEHCADALRGLVDVAVGGELLASLEHQMLEEVRHPVLLRAFGPRAGVERHQDGDGAGSRNRYPMQPHAVREHAHRDRRHRLPTVAIAEVHTRANRSIAAPLILALLISPANRVARSSQTGHRHDALATLRALYG